jgi:hypothetical protein
LPSPHSIITAAALPELELGTAITTAATSSATRPTNRSTGYSMTTAEIFNYAYAYTRIDHA